MMFQIMSLYSGIFFTESTAIKINTASRPTINKISQFLLVEFLSVRTDKTPVSNKMF